MSKPNTCPVDGYKIVPPHEKGDEVCKENCYDLSEKKCHGHPSPQPEKWEEQYDQILHGTNPTIIWGTRRLEWKDILDQGVFAPKFNALYDLLSQAKSQGAEEERARVRETVENAMFKAVCEDGFCQCCENHRPILTAIDNLPRV